VAASSGGLFTRSILVGLSANLFWLCYIVNVAFINMASFGSASMHSSVIK
jgi:hypothetical protein